MLLAELLISFLLVGLTSFGGMSMIPLISQQMLSHGWMTAQEVADIVAIAEMTPGPLGLNCATFAGTRTAGLAGAAVATVGVLLPSLTITMLAAMFFKRFRESRLMDEALYGIRPVCIGMIAAILVQQSLANYFVASSLSLPAVAIGIVALILILKFKLGVPVVILVSAALGLILG